MTIVRVTDSNVSFFSRIMIPNIEVGDIIFVTMDGNRTNLTLKNNATLFGVKDINSLTEFIKYNKSNIGDFRLRVKEDMVGVVLEELSKHTAFKLSHDNEELKVGYTEFGNINYNLKYDGEILDGELLIEVNNVTVNSLI